jgi:predicted alpha/beta-fold hydrolase
MDHPFKPLPPFRNPHVQTMLGSSRLRALGKGPLLNASIATVIDAGQGIRLLGFHSKQPPHKSRHALVALLHGWEGSSDSSYILSLGKYLYAKGYDIFRLNLRDHGDSHHLNKELFHGALIDETAAAIKKIACLANGNPFFLMGFSLGGNFLWGCIFGCWYRKNTTTRPYPPSQARHSRQPGP